MDHRLELAHWWTENCVCVVSNQVLGNSRRRTDQVWKGSTRQWDCHPIFIEYLRCTKLWIRCWGYKCQLRYGAGRGAAQRFMERKEHRPFCFRAFAANSSRETGRQKQNTKHGEVRTVSLKRRGRHAQASDLCWGDAKPRRSWTNSSTSLRHGFQVCEMGFKTTSLRGIVRIKQMMLYTLKILKIHFTKCGNTEHTMVFHLTKQCVPFPLH